MGSPEAASRLFFALWPTERAAKALASMRDDASLVRAGRAMPTDSLHCTLAFVGDQDAASLGRLMTVAAVVRGGSFDVRFDQLNYWPHNRIVWAGMSAEPPALVQLASQLHAGLHSAGFGPLAPLTMPHITLLRHARPDGVLPEPDPAAWCCAEFVLACAAKKEASSSRYEVLARWPLAGGGE